ncbi:Triacylglycerol lipase [Aphelenchoides besseyi]|nr:Triacylglycerol lipase [Aphelenchoides besseyi]
MIGSSLRFDVLFCFLLLSNSVAGLPKGPLTDHFQNWLIANGYEADSFERPDIGPNGSFGGKSSPSEKINNQPVIFIHGTGDAALHTQAPAATGWSRSIQYFLEQNYTSAELYATTWGDTWGTGNVVDSYTSIHTCAFLLTLRRFIEAVVAYTGARKIDVIAHSVGVPFARKVLKGGDVIATDGNCSLGPPLGRFVDTFLGISGPNYGLCVCQLAQTVPAWCNALDGLYPGYSCDDQLLCGYTSSDCTQRDYSAFLEKLNNDPNREGDHVYAMWSDVDEMVLYKTWGKPTSRIPGMNGRWVSDRNGHVAMKDLTELRQYEAVVHHSI